MEATIEIVGEFLTVVTIVTVAGIFLFFGFMFSHNKENKKKSLDNKK